MNVKKKTLSRSQLSAAVEPMVKRENKRLSRNGLYGCTIRVRRGDPAVSEMVRVALVRSFVYVGGRQISDGS
jgi:hypothetical protein